jgi:signal transduction histidine kinase/CheY-like chemotaxis protein
MLHEFLSVNRAELIERCRIKVAERHAPQASDAALTDGIPVFLDQLIKTLTLEQTIDPMRSRKVSGPAGGGKPALSEIGVTAARHGRDLLQHGFTIEQVVHDYGDLCQAITDLAFEHDRLVSIDEFRTLNRCLDNAIADAVTEFTYQHDRLVEDKEIHALNERLGFLAHELRDLIHTATLAVTAIKSGNVGLAGATGGVLDRSLIAMRSLVDRSLADVRMTAGMPPRHQLMSLADLIAEIKISASLEAQARGCGFTLSVVDPTLAVDADRDLLLSAIGNLLQNAFKFTARHTEVSLNAYAAADRILIDVEDHCGGLPPHAAEKMFVPFTQSSADKTGLGLGLSLSQRSVKANNGILGVRNIPGSGCIFTIDLPRHALPKPTRVSDPPIDAETARIGVPPAKKIRILIVDDNDSRAILAECLEREGYEVALSAEGREALKAQQKSPFDVLITDIFMPDTDGVETIREFRQKYPQTRIIAMSGANKNRVDYLSLSLEIGADKVLRKPFDGVALKTALKEVLAKQYAGACP